MEPRVSIGRRRGLSALALVVLLAGPWLAPAGAASSTSARVPVQHRRSLPGPAACPGCYAPALRTSWQWQLQFPVDMTVDADMYDVDAFNVKQSLVSRLHAEGRKVVCYFSAGSWENWRPDKHDFPASVLGRSNGWPGEKWLDIRRIGMLGPIMKARLDLCEAKGFDAVEFDNVDGYQNPTGFPLTGPQQLRYNVFLANQAHRRGMSAVLKNDLGQIQALLPYFDFALNEQCYQYHECSRLKPFVNAGKAVFGVEYRLARSQFCPRANAANFNFLKKRLGLGPWRQPCRGH
jgi:hypothetical protein